MSASAVATPVTASRRQPWIVSAWWDLAYVVVTPLAIVPVVLILARHCLTAEQVSLAVIAFASLGHHLPGFMRAYGDRELFLRFRWRFLLAPPLVLALALLFSPPALLASALHLPWKHLHGLELILLIWGTWHGLMQVYGFMRIYDVRLGVLDHRSARLDHALCVAVFAAGVVFSDARVFGIANAMWQSGLPLFGPEWLQGIRLVVGAAGIVVLVAYAWNLANRWLAGQPVSWIKLLLIGTTGWFYWYTGRLSTNLLIGLAMFEVYHAVQYYAIVWVYNRRLLERAGSRFGPLGFLFRDRWSMLGVYLAAIAAYSAIRFIPHDANEYVFRTASDSHQWLMALFVTSALLHFYFDGFIWKVSERKTQENLAEQVSTSSPMAYQVPGLVHAGKWVVLVSIAGGLLYCEWRQRDRWNVLAAERVKALAALTPDLPECQVLLSQEALARNDTGAAISLAERALALRPRSHAVHAELAEALMQAGRLDEACAQLEQAVALNPRSAENHYQLGVARFYAGKLEAAIESFNEAARIDPHDFRALFQLGNTFYVLHRWDEALNAYLASRKLQPTHAELCSNLGGLLVQLGRSGEALPIYAEGLEAHPDSATLNYNLGLLKLQQGKLPEARRLILRAEQLGTPPTPEVRQALSLEEAPSASRLVPEPRTVDGDATAR